jgi:uncharacterized protein (TIGR02757 family)
MPSSKKMQVLQKTQAFFEEQVRLHKTPTFIESDPVSIVHRYTEDPVSAEVVALITCLMAYGQRPAIIKALETLFYRFPNAVSPVEFIKTTTKAELESRLDGWYYRFYTAEDMATLLLGLGHILRNYGSLKASFLGASLSLIEDRQLLSQTTHQWNQLLRETLLQQRDGGLSYGCGYMFPNGKAGISPLKRLYLFLKWMVRFDADISPSVDLGFWADCIAPKALVIPLDTHVHAISLKHGLTQRKSKNLDTALEITTVLSQWHPEDPLIFDFAFMGIGTAKS